MKIPDTAISIRRCCSAKTPTARRASRFPRRRQRGRFTAAQRTRAPAEQIFPGLEPGSELGWGALAGGPKPLGIVDSHFKYLVFQNPDWDFRTLNFDSDVALADKLDKGIINATDPNLKEFVAHGGKLILYHGWNDWGIAPQNSVNYYNSVVAAMGGADEVQNSIRLFMAPGMRHCGGATVPPCST